MLLWVALFSPDVIAEMNEKFNAFIAAERQRGSTLFLTTTRPSLSPRSMYSRNLDLCPSVCLSVC